MIALPTEVCNHQYNRSFMNSSLLPLVRSIVNQLQDEALIANYTSGENLMTLYKTVLDLRHNRDLCAQTIITQNNFYNSVHVDMDARVTLNKEEIYLKPYITNVVK